MKKITPLVLFIFLQIIVSSIAHAQPSKNMTTGDQKIDLKGSWSFQLDSLDKGIDLLTNADQRPEARQLLFSLKSYMSKPEFLPHQNVDIQKIISLCN